MIKKGEKLKRTICVHTKCVVVTIAQSLSAFCVKREKEKEKKMKCGKEEFCRRSVLKKNKSLEKRKKALMSFYERERKRGEERKSIKYQQFRINVYALQDIS